MSRTALLAAAAALVTAACGSSDGETTETPAPGSRSTATATASASTPAPTAEALPSFRTDWPETDFSQHTIPYDEIRQGCPGPDCIPALDAKGDGVITIAAPRGGQARFQPVSEVGYEAQIPVAVLDLNGVARAYPLHILTFHEIVNDVVDGEPVAMAFCPLCNTAIAFARDVDGEVLDFGVSGLLRNSDLIMYDRQTESWWQQATGEAIVGAFAGRRLDFLSTRVTSWGEFAARYPGGTVLTEDTGFGAPYGQNPYASYDEENSRPFLFRGEIDERLPALQRVVGLAGPETRVAVPFSWLEENHVANLDLDGQPVVVFWAPGTVSALDDSSIPDSREIGSAVAYSPVVESQTLTFSSTGAGRFVDAETGSTWDITGLAVSGALAGAQLPVHTHANHFWFAFAAFWPEAVIWPADGTSS